MQVLGALVNLPEDGKLLPLPWWHRAPLGFQSRTWCYLSIVDSQFRPAGDLVLSVLDPSKWTKTVAIQCRRADEPGVVSNAIQAIGDTNIALAESITMESGSQHEITLICELRDNIELNELNKNLDKVGFSIDSSRTYPDRKILWKRRVEIQNGWIRHKGWKSEFEKFFADNPDYGSIDLSRAVVSADTGNRLMRFVFPYQHSRSISVEHVDEPGAMKRVCDVLINNKLNILSLLLRRGGASPGNAIMVAACEPQRGTLVPGVYDKVRAGIENLPPELMADIKISEGQDAYQTISPKEPATIISRIPPMLAERVRAEKKRIKEGQMPIFVSRRFTDDKRANRIADEVHAAIKEMNCHPLEASVVDQAPDPSLIFLEVSVKMWAAEAGIVLVPGLGDVDSLGKNLPHEFGFFQGQSKPLLLLEEGGKKSQLGDWTNIVGVHAPRFSTGDLAFDRQEKSSVFSIVQRWIASLKDM